MGIFGASMLGNNVHAHSGDELRPRCDVCATCIDCLLCQCAVDCAEDFGHERRWSATAFKIGLMSAYLALNVFVLIFLTKEAPKGASGSEMLVLLGFLFIFING